MLRQFCQNKTVTKSINSSVTLRTPSARLWRIFRCIFYILTYVTEERLILQYFLLDSVDAGWTLLKLGVVHHGYLLGLNLIWRKKAMIQDQCEKTNIWGHKDRLGVNPVTSLSVKWTSWWTTAGLIFMARTAVSVAFAATVWCHSTIRSLRTLCVRKQAEDVNKMWNLLPGAQWSQDFHWWRRQGFMWMWHTAYSMWVHDRRCLIICLTCPEANEGYTTFLWL